MSIFRTLDDFEPAGKRVLLRIDINVPMQNGVVSDITRLKAIAPTIHELVNKQAKVILLSHFGRPDGKPSSELSLKPILPALEQVLNRSVFFAEHYHQAAQKIALMNNGDILLLENIRFDKGEEANAPDFIDALASLGDIYVNDAFSTAHRAHASTHGVATRLPSYAGRLMQQELEALENVLEHPKHPVVAVVGGAKVSSKISLLENLVKKVDTLIIGGGMANTFLAALGKNVGKSLCEHDLKETALRILSKARAGNCAILLPVDATIAWEFKAHTPHETCSVDAVPHDAMILDAGVQSIEAAIKVITNARTLLWNGPFGAFELSPFDTATIRIAQAAAKATTAGTLLSVAGGGDTIAALNHAGISDQFSYISTAGGAFLEWLEGKTLPGVAALIQNDLALCAE